MLSAAELYGALEKEQLGLEARVGFEPSNESMMIADEAAGEDLLRVGKAILCFH